MIMENGICINNDHVENEGETTIPRPGHSPTEGSEGIIAYSESNCSEENQFETVGISCTGLSSSNVK